MKRISTAEALQLLVIHSPAATRSDLPVWNGPLDPAPAIARRVTDLLDGSAGKTADAAPVAAFTSGKALLAVLERFGFEADPVPLPIASDG